MSPDPLRRPLRGLYLITPGQPPARLTLIEAVAEALAGGVALVQYRDKGSDSDRRRMEAAALLELCRGEGVPLIINDDLALAAAIGADGVHLGRDDPSPRAARALLGPRALIGVSCYNEIERARAAAREGADYLAFGRFFPSGTKPQAVPADPALLREARPLGLPLVAIGGITPENGATLVAAGADMLAVIQGVFGKPHIRVACRAFNRLFADQGVVP